jgi:hypothetical protein
MRRQVVNPGAGKMTKNNESSLAAANAQLFGSQ